MSELPRPHLLVVDDDHSCVAWSRTTSGRTTSVSPRPPPAHSCSRPSAPVSRSCAAGPAPARGGRHAPAAPAARRVPDPGHHPHRARRGGRPGHGAGAGADDYLTKPFSPRELLARIRTVLRRAQAGQETHGAPVCRAYRFPGWELNLRTRKLTATSGAEVALSNGEFNLLAALLHCQPGRQPRPADRAQPALRQRGLRPCHRCADPAAAPQDRGQPGRATHHPDRARCRLPRGGTGRGGVLRQLLAR